MLRSAELNMSGMNSTIFRGLMYLATGGHLSIDGGNSAADFTAKDLYGIYMVDFLRLDLSNSLVKTLPITSAKVSCCSH